jgi:hypothetical protein
VSGVRGGERFRVRTEFGVLRFIVAFSWRFCTVSIVTFDGQNPMNFRITIAKKTFRNSHRSRLSSAHSKAIPRASQIGKLR